jgi:electron transfer flavoprotein alpha subunit
MLLQASTLVVVEHRNSKVAAPTLNTLSAAGQLGGDVTALVGGSGVQQVAEQAAALPGVNKVLAVAAAAAAPAPATAVAAAALPNTPSSSDQGVTHEGSPHHLLVMEWKIVLANE